MRTTENGAQTTEAAGGVPPGDPNRHPSLTPAAVRKRTKRKAKAQPPTKPRPYTSQTDVPSVTLDDALRIAQTIRDEYGGQPVAPFDVAFALQIDPEGRQLRGLTGASIAYGLTEGGAQAATIALTDLGRRIVAPTVDGDQNTARREAFLRPRIIGEFLRKYDGNPVPSDTVAMNVLESMGVDRTAVDRTLELIKTGADGLGLMVAIKDKKHVRLGGGAQTPIRTPHLPEGEGADLQNGDPATVAREPIPPSAPVAPLDDPSRSKPIFIGHGKKKPPLEKLEKILGGFAIPFKTAVTEPNLGRPIPKKVKDVMSQCGSAILIFTCDEEFRDTDGKTIWRPSENVVHELGAASFAYEDRVVIFKERGLFFPANYQSIGHIEFEEDSIESKTMELLKELIGFGLVRIAPA